MESPQIIKNHPLRGSKNQTQGFSILEVLVTIFVVSGFLIASLQATVLAILFRLQAEDKQEAINWIQEDLELIRYQAFILDSSTETSGLTPTHDDACNDTTYGQRLKDFIDSTYASTTTITINHKSYDVTRAYEDAGNILGISYKIEYDNDQPHPRFQTASGADNTVTALSTEVMPHAVLSCR